MDGSLKRKLAVATAATIAVAGAGGAIAATKLQSRRSESDAILKDAAGRLGVQPSALRSALEKAFSDRIDAAVAAGTITKAEGDALKARIRSGDFPIFGPPHVEFHGPFATFGPLDAAASYLGLTEAQLRADLDGGKTLAQVAKQRGKSVDGLIQAVTDAAKKRLDEAVSAGRLTRLEEQSILARLRARIADFVNGRFEHGSGFDRHRDFNGGPPAFSGAPL